MSNKLRIPGPPGAQGPPGDALESVGDGDTTVTDVSDIEFTSGATVTDAGGGLVQIAVAGTSTDTVSQGSGDWTTYQGDNLHTGFAAERILSPGNEQDIEVFPNWPKTFSQFDYGFGLGATDCQPIVANGLVYVTSIDGYVHALPRAGYDGQGWTSDALGICSGSVAVADVTLEGHAGPRPIVFVSAGNDFNTGTDPVVLFALDALTGETLWDTDVSTQDGSFAYGSVVVADDKVYVGIAAAASSEDQVQGQLVQVDATNGDILGRFKTVPDGDTGATVWGSPAVDDDTGDLFFLTGNPGFGSGQDLAVCIIRMGSDLALIDSWQVPAMEQTGDSDFGTAPTLFHGTVTNGGDERKLVAAANKNGTIYIWDADDLASGPVKRITSTGNQIASSAFDGEYLYTQGTNVAAWNPNDFTSAVWTVGSVNSSSQPLAVSNGLLVVSHVGTVSILDAHTGASIFTYSTGSATLWGGACIAHGVIYVASPSGQLYAFAARVSDNETAWLEIPPSAATPTDPDESKILTGAGFSLVESLALPVLLVDEPDDDTLLPMEGRLWVASDGTSLNIKFKIEDGSVLTASIPMS